MCRRLSRMIIACVRNRPLIVATSTTLMEVLLKHKQIQVGDVIIQLAKRLEVKLHVRVNPVRKRQIDFGLVSHEWVKRKHALPHPQHLQEDHVRGLQSRG